VNENAECTLCNAKFLQCGMKKLPNVTQKWCEMLAHFTKENINTVNIKCLISFCLALPGSNGLTEHVFS
jgi:hypothetical protein